MSLPDSSPLAHAAFAEIDRHFAALMERLAGGGQPEVALAAALACHRARDGGLPADLRAPDAGHLRCGDTTIELALPERDSWLAKLRASCVVGAPGDCKPLILDEQGRLFLHRCWQQHQGMANGSPGGRINV